MVDKTLADFSVGVVLSIMPPKKSWRPIANLSGGEKTLASLALVFALHVFKPTPLYFMVSPVVSEFETIYVPLDME
jgi:structural maintenance of chromosome 4